MDDWRVYIALGVMLFGVLALGAAIIGAVTQRLRNEEGVSAPYFDWSNHVSDQNEEFSSVRVIPHPNTFKSDNPLESADEVLHDLGIQDGD